MFFKSSLKKKGAVYFFVKKNKQPFCIFEIFFISFCLCYLFLFHCIFVFVCLISRFFLGGVFITLLIIDSFNMSPREINLRFAIYSSLIYNLLMKILKSISRVYLFDLLNQMFLFWDRVIDMNALFCYSHSFFGEILFCANFSKTTIDCYEIFYIRFALLRYTKFHF